MPYERRHATPAAPDLIGVLAGALTHTKKELTQLDDLAEQVQRSAGALIALAPRTDAGRRAGAELRRSIDQLVGWQISHERHVGIARRARARAELEKAQAAHA